MAIFSKKQNNEETVEETQANTTEPVKEPEISMKDVSSSGIGSKGLVVPRISEKAGSVGKLNKYIFTIYGKLNKIEVKSAVEKMYGVKVENVNMIKVLGKPRRYGSMVGKRSDFKKAMVTLTKDSKKIDLVEPS